MPRSVCLLVLAACSSGPKADGSGGAAVAVTALSADEIVATVTVHDDGQLVCGDATRGVVAGSSTVYLAGLPPGQTATCTATSGRAQASADVALPDAISAGLVVFDNAHGEQSGNADWVIDDDAPSPNPSEPNGPDDWTGAYSSFGYDLWRDGYALRTNTARIDTSALAGAAVLVLPEPNNALSDAELAAVASFVARGGGLVLITDHHGSDRDHDGVDSTDVADTLFAALGAGTREAPEGSDAGTEQNTTASAGDPADPVLHGRNGDVARFDLYEGSDFALSGLPEDRPVLWPQGHAGDDSAGARVAATYVGAGRVLAICDSSPADDGTGARGDQLYASWNEADDAALFLNGVDWAAGVR